MNFSAFWLRDEQRPLGDVPDVLKAGLALALTLQILSAWLTPLTANTQRSTLPLAPSPKHFQAASFGDALPWARLANLWVQSFDHPAGTTLPFSQLDYQRVISWLDLIQTLDPSGHYPLLAASRVYTEIADPNKQRQMLDFVEQQFRLAPIRRWRWMAHAVYIARHRLHDMPLALRYARALREQARHPDVPGWATQMEIFILADMNEIEAAKVLLGGLLDSGQISNPEEARFLMQQLQAWQ